MIIDIIIYSFQIFMIITSLDLKNNWLNVEFTHTWSYFDMFSGFEKLWEVSKVIACIDFENLLIILEVSLNLEWWHALTLFSFLQNFLLDIHFKIFAFNFKLLKIKIILIARIYHNTCSVLWKLVLIWSLYGISNSTRQSSVMLLFQIRSISILYGDRWLKCINHYN